MTRGEGRSGASAGRAQLLADWATQRVTLVLPTAEMYAYNRHLAELELFYADFLRELAGHETVRCLVPDDAHAEKMMRLSGLPAEVFSRATIPDIWIRDFAPLAAHGPCIKFRYEPPYSRKKLSREVDAAFLSFLSRSGVSVACESLALEGGNLVHNGAGIGIATEKLLDLNKSGPRGEIVSRLETTLGLERLILVPSEPEDRTGHIDGMMRWASEGVLLVNGYGRIDGAGRFKKQLAKILDRELPRVERVEVPYVWSTGRLGGWYDVRGNYANFLLTSHRAYVPTYGLPEDEEAGPLFEKLFPGRVSYVPASVISRYGGSLNCITWNHA